MKRIAPLFALLLSCGGDQAAQKSPEPMAQPAPVEPASKIEPEPSAIEPSEQPVPEGGDCVTECVASRQMQATSIEQITSDCEKSCASESN